MLTILQKQPADLTVHVSWDGNTDSRTQPSSSLLTLWVYSRCGLLLLISLLQTTPPRFVVMGFVEVTAVLVGLIWSRFQLATAPSAANRCSQWISTRNLIMGHNFQKRKSTIHYIR